MNKLLANLMIVLSGMILTLLLIDRVNSAMVFIDNRYTKFLLFAMCFVGFAIGIKTLYDGYKKQVKRERKHRMH